MKFPFEETKLQANAFFYKQLHKCDTSRFTAWGWGTHSLYWNVDKSIDFAMLNEAEKAMKTTTKYALEGRLLDAKVQEDPSSIPNHVNSFREACWTHAVTPHPFSGDQIDLENLSDLDSMAINLGIDEWRKGKKKTLINLQWLVVDIANEVAMGVAPIA